MSSTFVPSVERVNLQKNRGGRPARHAAPLSAQAVPSPVYQLGRKSSIALQKNRNRWGWEWLAADSGTPLVVPRPPTLLFPATREEQPSTKFSLDVVLQAAMRYIHDTPDIYEPDVVAQLVAEELTAQHTQQAPIEYSGRTVAVIQHPMSRLARTLLAFPMGPVGQDLNISAFLPTSNARHHGRLQSRFVPCATAVQSFPTTILQIVSSSILSHNKRVDNGGTVMLVRIDVSTHILNVLQNANFIPPTMAHPVTILRVGELSVAATEGRKHVDMDLCPSNWSRAAVVDEGGAVWLWSEQKENVNGLTQKLMKLEKVRDAVDEPNDGFFRVAFGTRQDTLIVLSRSSVTTIDIASSPATLATILKTNDPSNTFTAIDKTAAARDAQFTCICSTKELMWITDTTNGAPDLRWSHHRGEKQSTDVDILVIPADQFGDGDRLEQMETVMVFSPDLGTVQAVQVSTDRPARLMAMPWVPGGITKPIRSPVLLPFQDLSEHHGSAHVVGATNEGALQIVKLIKGDSTKLPAAKPTAIPNVKWSEPVQALARRAAGIQLPEDKRDWDPKAEARYEVLSARWAWSQINEWDLSEFKLHATAFQQDLQESDTRLEHIVTASERARDFQFGEPQGTIDDHPMPRPSLLRRLEFFAQEQQCLENLAEKYPTYFSFVGRTGSLLGANPVGKTPVAVRSGQVRADAEVSRLNSDLALSSSILWSEALVPCDPDACTKPTSPTGGSTPAQSDPDDLFAAATGQLSLEERPTDVPPMRLLPPRISEREHVVAPPTDFVTAEPLLGEWTIGDDVRQYQWSKVELSAGVPYSADTTDRLIRPLPSVRTSASQPTLPMVAAHQSLPTIRFATAAVPPVLAASSYTPIIRPIPYPAASRSSPPPAGDDSQDAPFPHTQVERGPFGARPEATRIVRKKAAKKRQGGF